MMSQVNLLDDSDGGQNYPLRPYTLTNLTDVLAVEWTCNNTFGTKEKELGMLLPPINYVIILQPSEEASIFT